MSSLRDVQRAQLGTRRALVDKAIAAAKHILSSDEEHLLLLQNVDDAVATLKRRRNSLPNADHQKPSTHFTQLDNVLLPLLQVHITHKHRFEH